MKLKPCPFCGDLAWIHSGRVFNDGAIGYRVECEGSCHAMTCYWHEEKDAIKHWNMRTKEMTQPMKSNEEIVRIEVKIAGVGNTAHEYDHCPISLAMGDSGICPLTLSVCNYGLTNIQVPAECPMSGGSELLMRFTIKPPTERGENNAKENKTN